MPSETCKAHEYYGRLKPCNNTDIAVYLYKKNEEYPICNDCWGKISKLDIGVEEIEEKEDTIKGVNWVPMEE